MNSTPLILGAFFGGYVLGHRIGTQTLARSVYRVHQLMLDGLAVLRDDGTVEMVDQEPSWETVQAGVAREGLQ